jgi:hypothetical protein
LVFDSVPPVTLQLTSSVLLTSTAENTVGWVIGDDSADGVMVSDGALAGDVSPHPPSNASKTQATATSDNERINDSQANEV